MRIGDLLWFGLALFIVAAICGALVLLIWWLWRKITLPQGAPPPKWTDLAALRGGAARAPIALRLIVIVVLGFLMSAPVAMLYDLIGERTRSYRSVVRELSHSWGGQQLLIGPVMTVPYTITYKVIDNVPLTEAEAARFRKRGIFRTTKDVEREESQTHMAVLLPEELRIEGELKPEQRRRGIYSVQVYTAELALAGSFKKPDFTVLDKRVSQVHWDQARILVNLSDTKAFRGISSLSLAGELT
ncbi:cell envelope integrity protein CreD [Deltaproteobacteria bacterium OttesenSCG-928-K17]|nr:cell envelope integrity protein CreD [Deltaproteobacteria bacterium OttesenSCG-928-K17]